MGTSVFQNRAQERKEENTKVKLISSAPVRSPPQNDTTQQPWRLFFLRKRNRNRLVSKMVYYSLQKKCHIS
jgi:hypothetical protein